MRGGSLKPGSRDCSPEAYIRRIRRLIEEGAPPARGNWYPSIRVAEAHPLSTYAKHSGLAIEREQRYGDWLTRVLLTEGQRNLVFDIADRFTDLRGWQLAAVSGLPAS